MVEITRAERGGTRTQLWSKGQGQTERGRRLEDQNKEQISKNSTIYDNKQKI
jgi:hypothetical protein